MGQKYALLIGLEHYKLEPKLKSATNDVMDLAQALEVACNFHVTRRICSGGDLEPTPHNIRQEINNAIDNLRVDDFFLMFVAGHGEEVNGMQYLKTLDAGADNTEEPRIDLAYYSSMLRQKLLARRCVFIYDICRSILKRGNNISSDQRASHKGMQSLLDDFQSLASKTSATLFACRAGESSHCPDKYGLLAHSLIDEIYDDQSLGELSFIDLATAASKRVRDYCSKSDLMEQTPELHFKGNTMDLVLREAPTHTHLQKTTSKVPPEAFRKAIKKFDAETGLLPLTINAIKVIVLSDARTAIVAGACGNIIAVDTLTGDVSEPVYAEQASKQTVGGSLSPRDCFFFLHQGKVDSSFLTMGHEGVLKHWVYDGEFHITEHSSLISPNKTQFHNAIKLKKRKWLSWSRWTAYNQELPERALDSIEDAQLSPDGKYLVVLTAWFCVARFDMNGQLQGEPMICPDCDKIFPATKSADKFFAGGVSGRSYVLTLFDFNSTQAKLISGDFENWDNYGFVRISEKCLWANGIAINTETLTTQKLPSFEFYPDTEPAVSIPTNTVFTIHDSKIIAFSTQNGLKQGHFFEGHHDSIHALATGIGDNKLISVSDKCLQVWNVRQKRPLYKTASDSAAIQHGLEPNNDRPIDVQRFMDGSTLITVHREKYGLFEPLTNSFRVLKTECRFIGSCDNHDENHRLLTDLVVQEDEHPYPEQGITKHMPIIHKTKNALSKQTTLYLRFHRIVKNSIVESWRCKVLQDEPFLGRYFTSAHNCQTTQISHNKIALLVYGKICIVDTEKRQLICEPLDFKFNKTFPTSILAIGRSHKVLLWGHKTSLTIFDAEKFFFKVILPQIYPQFESVLLSPIDGYAFIGVEVKRSGSTVGNDRLVLIDLAGETPIGFFEYKKLWQRYDPHTAVVDSSGTRIIYESSGEICIRNLLTPDLEEELIGTHAQYCASLTLLEKGDQVMSVSMDGTAKIWDIPPLAQPLNPDEAIAALTEMVTPIDQIHLANA